MGDSSRTMTKFYSRFGSDVIGAIQAKAKPDGDINHLLRHFGLPTSGVLDRQHRTLSQFIQSHGRPVFLKALSLSGGAVAVRQFIQDVERKAAMARRSEDTAPDDDTKAQEGSSGPVDPDKATVAKGKAIASGRQWIETETYTGPDRRSRGDRRQGPRDRRQRVDLITFKNRRFGAPRRKKGRRSGDPK